MAGASRDHFDDLYNIHEVSSDSLGDFRSVEMSGVGEVVLFVGRHEGDKSM